MDIAITAIGTASPPYKRSQREAAELVAAVLNLKTAERRILKSLYKATGIEYRYSVLSDYNKEPGQFEFFPNHPNQAYPSTAQRMQVYKDNAIHLALKAIENCFSEIKYEKSGITHLITVSCTGMYAPGIDIEIVERLGLNPATKRTAINFMGCYGAFNAIKLAEAICKSDPEAHVLIVCVELCTIHFQNNLKMDNMVSNAIFADGAAAALVQAKPKVNKYLCLNYFYCDLLPQSSKEMAWHIADSGFDIVLSTYVSEVIESGIVNFMERLLQNSMLALSDIDFYAIHPGGLKILQACEKALNIAKDQNKYAYQILRDYGNMSSATILFLLKVLFNDIDATTHNKNIFSCAFGPGLTLESMILRTHYV
ncbi:MAG: type III polyketide synthase [Gammaproteobacteria bacterium]